MLTALRVADRWGVLTALRMTVGCVDCAACDCQVGVHIADVSHFIRPGTAIDKEAANRGTTVYLIDKRIDMVPGRSDSPVMVCLPLLCAPLSGNSIRK